MAIYRAISMNFWTDSKIVDDLTPEDRYFYLYLLTNPHTTLSGCYEISVKQIAYETGYSVETVNRLLERFKVELSFLDYCAKTREVLLYNWHKYNWQQSPKVLKALENSILEIKYDEFKKYCIDTLSIQYGKSMDITVTVTVTDTVSDADTVSDTDTEKENNYLEERKEIIEYLNMRLGTNYKHQTKESSKFISGRLGEGYTVQDFKDVIDKKCVEWVGTDFEKFLTPTTLFRPSNFEKYYNQKGGTQAAPF